MIKTLVAAAIMAVALSGCGGGGGGNSTPSAPPSPPMTRITPLEFGFFGDFPGQTDKTKTGVTYVFPMDWGDWTTQEEGIQITIINMLKEAKANGINKAVIGVGFLTWDSKWNLKGTGKLQAFKSVLQQEGLYDMVIAVYPLDEPDVAIKQHGLIEGVLQAGLLNVKAVFSDKKVMAIYGDEGIGMPEQAFFDWVGKDKYGSGLIVASLMAGQKGVLVRGGANPWREDAQTAVDYANQHDDIAIVVGFVFGGYTDPNGNFQQGMENNGMLPSWLATGAQVIKDNNGRH